MEQSVTLWTPPIVALFFRVLRQKSTALASTTGPVPIPLQHDSPQLFEEDGPVPFLPTQAACPISQPLMVGRAQGWAQFSRYGVPGIVWQASEGIVSEEVCLPQPFPKPLDFVFLVSFDSLHLFFPGLPLAWSQPASFLIWATATVFFWSVFSCIHVSLHPVCRTARQKSFKNRHCRPQVVLALPPSLPSHFIPLQA